MKKNGVELYADKIRVNRNLLFVIFVYCIVIILFDLYRIASINKNATTIMRAILFTPLGVLTSLFFYKVFLRK